MEKKIYFKDPSDNNKVYVFFSSIPDDHKATIKGISRAYSITGYHVFEVNIFKLKLLYRNWKMVR